VIVFVQWMHLGSLQLTKQTTVTTRGLESTYNTLSDSMTETKPITRYTRAGRDGKLIMCTCGAIHRVYHFSWCASQCQSCEKMIDKYDYKEVISK
jgi:hypothetical protein